MADIAAKSATPQHSIFLRVPFIDLQNYSSKRSYQNCFSIYDNHGKFYYKIIYYYFEIINFYQRIMGGHFRYSVWDPPLIIAQIITIQSIFYASLGLWIFLTNVLNGTAQSLDQIFLYQQIHVKNFHGQCIVGSYLINSLCCSLGLWYFVQRTKLCLDFTITAHLLHLLMCWIYNSSFPHTLSWWLLNIVCITIMCVCGEFLCMRTELKAIPLSLGPKADL